MDYRASLAVTKFLALSDGLFFLLLKVSLRYRAGF